MAVTRVGAVDIGWDEIGSGEPLLLITGVGCQRVMWPDGLCEAFARRGFRVIRYDHRDVGESSRIEGPGPPPLPLLAARALAGRPIQAPYDLPALAGDAAGLLSALGIERAHVLGASMGGMIAQELALRHPQRVRTLTSVMSSPGGRRFLLVHPKVVPGVLRRRPRSDDEVVRSSTSGRPRSCCTAPTTRWCPCGPAARPRGRSPARGS